MENNNFKENPSVSFLQRWVRAFSRILKKIGLGDFTDNDRFVTSVLSDEIESASSPESIETLEEKRQLLMEMCEDVDAFYKAKTEASKSRDLESWFRGRVSEFTQETIPDADKSDVNEVEKFISDSFDQEIALKTKLLEDSFNVDDEERSNAKNEKQ